MRVKITYLAQVVLLVAAMQGLAQKPLEVVDSLQLKLSKASNDTARALIMAELAFRYYTIPDSIKSIAQRGLALAKSINHDRAIAANLASLVAYYSNTGDNLNALKFASEAIRAIKKVGDKRLLGRIYLHSAMIHSRMGETVKSLGDFKKALSLMIQVNDAHLMSLGYNNVGYTYFLLGKYDSSEFYLGEALQVAKLRARQNLYLILGSLAELSEKKGDHKRAFDFLQESIRLNSNADISISSDSYLQMSKLSLRLNNITDAFLYGQESLRLAEKANMFVRIKPAAEFLSNLYEKNRQFEKANWYLKKNLVASDSIYSIARRKELTDIKRQFENEVHEAQITILQQENTLKKLNIARQEEKLSLQRILLIIAVFLVGLLMALLVSLRSQSLARKNYIKLIETSRNEVQKKAKQLSELNEELIVLNVTLEIRAKEKAQQLIANEEKLRRYAFLNSHHLRGPVATILGIANLMESGYVKESEHNDLMGKAIDEIKKIDEVIKEITQAIY